MSALNNRTVETKVLSTLKVSSVLFELDNEIESDNESEDETDCYNCKNCDENHLVDKMYKIEDSDDEDNGMYLLCRLCFSESEDICKGCYKKCPEPIAIGCMCDDCEDTEQEPYKSFWIDEVKGIRFGVYTGVYAYDDSNKSESEILENSWIQEFKVVNKFEGITKIVVHYALPNASKYKINSSRRMPKNIWLELTAVGFEFGKSYSYK